MQGARLVPQLCIVNHRDPIGVWLPLKFRFAFFATSDHHRSSRTIFLQNELTRAIRWKKRVVLHVHVPAFLRSFCAINTRLRTAALLASASFASASWLSFSYREIESGS